MSKEFKISTTDGGGAHDVDMQYGDLRLETDDVNIVVQRVKYRILTWLRESPYDRSAGVPYIDGVFGLEPVEAVVSLISQIILDTEGVDEFIEPVEFDLGADRELSMTCVLRVSGDEVPLSLGVNL